MALFKVTVKRSMSFGSQRLEAGMTAEVSYPLSSFPWANPKVRAEIKRQFKMKYNVDFPNAYIGNAYFDVEKL